MVSRYLALIALLWRVDHSKGENYHFMTNTDLYFASYVYNYLSEAILLRCTKYSLEIELQELSSPVPHEHTEQFSFKSIKGIYIPAKIIIPCQFITDPLKSLRIIFHQSLSTR